MGSFNVILLHSHYYIEKKEDLVGGYEVKVALVLSVSEMRPRHSYCCFRDFLHSIFLSSTAVVFLG